MIWIDTNAGDPETLRHSQSGTHSVHVCQTDCAFRSQLLHACCTHTRVYALSHTHARAHAPTITHTPVTRSTQIRKLVIVSRSRDILSSLSNAYNCIIAASRSATSLTPLPVFLFTRIRINSETAGPCLIDRGMSVLQCVNVAAVQYTAH